MDSVHVPDSDQNYFHPETPRQYPTSWNGSQRFERNQTIAEQLQSLYQSILCQRENRCQSSEREFKWNDILIEEIIYSLEHLR